MPTVLNTKLKKTKNLPTTVIVNGLDIFGYNLAKTLTSQGGYVVMVADISQIESNQEFIDLKNTTFVDYESLAKLSEEIRRVDYIFFLNHSLSSTEQFSSAEFLATSSYLQKVLDLATSFAAKFVITNSVSSHRQLQSVKLHGININDYTTAGSVDYFTASEIVRYTESLVVDYIDTKNLTGKIVRLGEIIGEGSLLSANSPLEKMIRTALNQDTIYIDGDGLDEHYFVHILDAVYGVLKAQFSDENPSIRYTLAYNQPFTSINIAYKIQDIIPEIVELKFLPTATSKTNIDYRPADFLSVLGWQPKINFEDALRETVLFQLELTQQLLGDEQTPDHDAESNKQTALSSLLDPYKQRQEYKKQKFQLAVSSQQKPKSSPLNSIQKNISNFIKDELSFLSQMSLWEGGIYAVMFGAFIGLFIFILSPVAVIARDFTLISINYENLSAQIENRNFSEIIEDTEELTNRMQTIDKNLDRLEPTLEFIGYRNVYSESKALIQSLDAYNQSLQNSASTILDAQLLYSAYGTDLVYRPSNSSLLSTNFETESNARSDEAATISTQTLLNKADLATQSLATADRIGAQVDINELPGFTQNYLTKILDSSFLIADLNQDAVRTAGFVDYLGQDELVLGIVWQDGQRQTLSGGKLYAAGVLNYERGQLTSVDFRPISEITDPDISMSPSVAAEFESLTGFVPESELGFNDSFDNFDYLYTDSIQQLYLSRLLTESFNTQVNSTIIFNSAVLPRSLEKRELTINDQLLTAENFTQAQNIAVNNQSDLDEYLTNVSAVITEQLFAQTQNTDIYELTLEMSDFLSLNLVRGNSQFNESLQRVFDANNQISLLESVQIAYINSTASNSSTFGFEEIEIISSANYQDDFLSKTLGFSNLGSISAGQLLVCLPIGSQNIETDSNDQFELIELNNQRCVMNNTTNSELKISYLRSYPNNRLELDYRLSSGIPVSLDFDISYSTDKVLESSNPLINETVSGAFYTRDFLGKFNFILVFE